MRIAYISHTRFPNEKAHGYQQAQVCGALAVLGHKVTMLVPSIYTAVQQSYEKYYGVLETFSVIRVPMFDALSSKVIPGRLAFTVSMRSYGKALNAYLKRENFDLLYLRSPVLLSTAIRSGIPTVMELHTLPRRGRSVFAKQCNRCTKVVCLIKAMRDAVVALGVNKKRVLVEADAVDTDRFAKLPSKDKAKHHFDLPKNRTVIGYVGSLVTMDRVQKGVNILVEAMAMLKKHNIPAFVWIVGGPAEYRKRYWKLALHMGLGSDDIRFDDPIPPSHVPDALRAMDICVYPAPLSKHVYFQRDTSPLKLFEYLASGAPVVCADIPPVRDIVDKHSVRLVHPGNAKSLLGGITDVIQDPKSAAERSKQGLEIVKSHTWQKRMQRILDTL